MTTDMTLALLTGALCVFIIAALFFYGLWQVTERDLREAERDLREVERDLREVERELRESDIWQSLEPRGKT